MSGTTSSTTNSVTAVISANPFPVKPAGLLIGSFLALLLYGVHLAQVQRYYTTYKNDQLRTKFLVGWVVTLSSAQILIIVSSGFHYFVSGINDSSVWGEFWWPLSFQDGLIPLMAFTAQLYFGRRAWVVLGRKKWFAICVIVATTITMLAGIALAITARIWANDPWVSITQLDSRSISIPSQVVAITWMGLSAATDGSLTFILLWRFSTAHTSSPRLIGRLIALTLETVLLTHLVGAVMCVLFLTSPSKERTCRDEFWVLLEIVTELYALSILFTINSRAAARRLMRGALQMTTVPSPPTPSEPTSESETKLQIHPGEDLGQTMLDRHVEGYQGNTPFGVHISNLAHFSSPNGSGATSSLFGNHSRFNSGSSPSNTPDVSPRTPHVLGPHFCSSEPSKSLQEQV